MSCKNCGHFKRCHSIQGAFTHSSSNCRLASPICSYYVKWKKGDSHHMQKFYDSCNQGKSWKKGTKERNGKFYGVLKNNKDFIKTNKQTTREIR